MTTTTPAPTSADVLPAGPLGVAVLGYSFMGKAHSNAWRNVNAFHPSPQVAQKVLVGRDAAQVDEAARQYGWEESLTDWQQILDRDDIHIVDICTPGHLHAEIAIAALDAGKHVIVEKPLANTLAEAGRMAAAAQRARARGVHSMVAFNYRRVPALALARKLISEGRVGEIRQLRVSYLQDWLADEDAPMTWRLRKETAGSGALGDLASHAADQVRFLCDSPIESLSGSLNTFVKTRTGSNGPEQVTVDDAAWATLRLASGAVASLEVSRFANGRKNSLEIEVYGSQGSLSFNLERLNELQFFDATTDSGSQGFRTIMVTEPTHPYLEAWWPAGHIVGWDSTFTNQAAEFLNSIRTGTAPSPSFEDGFEVQRVLAAIETSAAQSSAAVVL